MKEIILLCGPPGSGKSTYAQKQLNTPGYYVNQKDKVEKYIMQCIRPKGNVL